MPHIINKLLLVSCICLFPAMGWANIVKTIESFGVYAVGKDGYVKVDPYLHIDRFVTFNYLHEIPSVERNNNVARFVVYSQDFKQGNVSIALRPVEVNVVIAEAKFDVKPLSQKNMYEITLSEPIPDGHMVHIHYDEFYGYNMGVIMLGNTEQELVKYFSRTNLDKAYAVLSYLKDARKAFPANPRLKDLQPHWEKAARDEKDIKAFSYIDEEWRKYNETQKLHLKVRYLRAMLGEANSYLLDYPDGLKAAEVKQRKEYAEKKIKEYEPQL